jgi:hypothetical protein
MPGVCERASPSAMGSCISVCVRLGLSPRLVTGSGASPRARPAYIRMLRRQDGSSKTSNVKKSPAGAGPSQMR